MEFGPPTGGDVEAKLEELRAAIYSLADVIQRQLALVAPEQLAKISKIDDLVRALEMLARQSEKTAAVVAGIAPALTKMQQVFEVNQKQIAELGGRIDGLRDSLAWTARQSSDLTALIKQLGDRLQAMPTAEQLSRVAKTVENLSTKDDLAAMAAKLDKVVESYGWMAREMSALSESVVKVPATVEERLAKGGEQITLMNDALAAMAAKLDAGLKAVSASLNSATAQAESIRKQNDALTDALAAMQRDLSRNIAGLEGLPSKIQAGVVSSTAALDAKIAGMQDNLAKLSEAFGSASGKVDSLATSMSNKVDSLSSKIGDLADKIDETKSISEMLTKESAYAAASGHELAASLETRLKQGDVQVEALTTLAKKLDAMAASLKTAIDRVEEAAGKTVSAERFELMAAQVEALNNAANASIKSSEEAGDKLERALATVRDGFDKQGKQADLMIELLSTLAKEATEARKVSQEVKTRLESGRI